MDITNSILSDITVFNKYARHIPIMKRRETWKELVTRNKRMHIRKYPHIEQEIEEAYQYVYDKKILPSMRSLQFGGKAIELANNRIYNCAFMPIDHIDAFSELMFLLLGGTGVGYSVQKHNIKQLPIVIGPQSERRRFVVADSIEGWADAIKVLVESYFLGKHKLVLDYSDIRAKGAALVTSGGKAPGPEPLKKCIKQISRILDSAIGRKLRSIEIHDISCYIADAVRSGGIRRAAMISLFDQDDQEMMNAKGKLSVTLIMDNGITRVSYKDIQYDLRLSNEDKVQLYEKGVVDWFHLFPERARANNSVVLLRNQVTQNQFNGIMNKIQESRAGEPGVLWTSNLTWGTNPCGEIALKPFQFCNLCEINASDVVDQKDFNNRAKAAAIVGTLQAGYTDFHYLRSIWKETTEQEALIGVGITGIGSGKLDNIDLIEAAEIVVDTNTLYAEAIGINPSARTTTIKPSGTSSLVVGSSSGVHAWHNDYYIRRMRVGKNEALYHYMLVSIPALVKDDLFDTNGAILEFPQKAPEGSIYRTESAQHLLQRVSRFNREWIRHGHISGDNTNNVSCTISVRDEEWPLVTDWMWHNRNEYNGISLLPYDGGTYIQAPFEDITEAIFNEMISHLHSVDLTQIVEIEDHTTLVSEVACGGGGCEA